MLDATNKTAAELQFAYTVLLGEVPTAVRVQLRLSNTADASWDVGPQVTSVQFPKPTTPSRQKQSKFDQYPFENISIF